MDCGLAIVIEYEIRVLMISSKQDCIVRHRMRCIVSEQLQVGIRGMHRQRRETRVAFILNLGLSTTSSVSKCYTNVHQ